MNLLKRLVIALEKIADKKDTEFIVEDVKNLLIQNVRAQELMMEKLKLKDLQRRYFYLKEKQEETLTQDEQIEIAVWEKHFKDRVAQAVP